MTGVSVERSRAGSHRSFAASGGYRGTESLGRAERQTRSGYEGLRFAHPNATVRVRGVPADRTARAPSPPRPFHQHRFIESRSGESISFRPHACNPCRGTAVVCPSRSHSPSPRPRSVCRRGRAVPSPPASARQRDWSASIPNPDKSALGLAPHAAGACGRERPFGTAARGGPRKPDRIGLH